MGAQYCAVSAKLKAMYGSCLDADDYNELLSRRTVPEICGYLKQNTVYAKALEGYNEETAHRGVLETKLMTRLFDEYSRLYTFMNQKQRSFLGLWNMQWEIKVLQRAMRYIVNHEEIPQWFGDDATELEIKKHTRIKLDALAAARSMSEVIAACANTPYKEILETGEKLNLDLFSSGMRLDRFYIETLWKAKNSLEREDKDAFASWLGTDIDMMNIMWIYRGKKFWDFSNERIYTYILPIRYRLSSEDISRMVQSDDPKALEEYVKANTIYGDLFDSHGEGIFIEENYNYIAHKKARSIMSAHPLTMAAVYAYINIKELEISNITIIIEGIRYGINPDNIKKHIKIGGI